MIACRTEEICLSLMAKHGRFVLSVSDITI